MSLLRQMAVTAGRHHTRVGLGETPTGTDPVAICAQHGGFRQQVMKPDKYTYDFLCTDGYTCSKGNGSAISCFQGSPSDVLSVAQAYPPITATAQAACAQHSGVYSEVADTFSSTVVCVDGTVCITGAEATCTTGAPPPLPPISQGTCPSYSYVLGGACACLPGYQAIAGADTLTCVPDSSGIPQINMSPNGTTAAPGSTAATGSKPPPQGAAPSSGNLVVRSTNAATIASLIGKKGMPAVAAASAPMSLGKKFLFGAIAVVGVGVVAVGAKVAYKRIKKK